MPPIRRILHLAPFNTSGVPITFVRAERKLGFDSRLITLGRDRRGYEEDICLDLPFLDFTGTRWAKRFFSDPSRMRLSNLQKKPERLPPTWEPHSLPEKWAIRFRERIWKKKIRKAMREVDFWRFDLYQLEGGLEFFRDGSTVKQLKRMGKKILCLYTGSDLRTRGIIPEVDEQANLRLTLEYDHLELDPRLSHILFPFEFDRFKTMARNKPSKGITIGHAPTNREAKGTEIIIRTVQSLANEFPITLRLIEGMPHAEAIRCKADCDVFIDNLGELGYGVNAIEALALGVCTCTSLMAEFKNRYPDHPFVEINFDNLKDQLRKLCADAGYRTQLAQEGRAWAEKNHSAEQVVRMIHNLLKQN